MRSNLHFNSVVDEKLEYQVLTWKKLAVVTCPLTEKGYLEVYLLNITGNMELYIFVVDKNTEKHYMKMTKETQLVEKVDISKG